MLDFSLYGSVLAQFQSVILVAMLVSIQASHVLCDDSLRFCDIVISPVEIVGAVKWFSWPLRLLQVNKIHQSEVSGSILCS